METEPGSMEEAVSSGGVEGVSIKEIADKFGTPCYVYSAKMVSSACRAFISHTSGLDARVCYAVKANGNISLLELIAKEGLAFDVSSWVEGRLVDKAGGRLSESIMTGPGKSADDIKFAMERSLEEIICDSAQELDLIEQVASGSSRRIRVGLRINPQLDTGAHPHLATGERGSKFGVSKDEALPLFERIAASNLVDVGCVNCHIGSQIGEARPYIEAARLLMELRSDLAVKGIEVDRVDLGGGFGIGDAVNRPGGAVLEGLVSWLSANCANVRLGFQPGRCLVARAGVLLATVRYVKQGHVIVDAGMTELIRPSLYGSLHGVAKIGCEPAGPGGFDVVGPVCENADFIARGVGLDVGPGDVVAVFDAGAYASTMAMGYNGRLRPCEVIVDDGAPALVRQRQDFDDYVRAETQALSSGA